MPTIKSEAEAFYNVVDMIRELPEDHVDASDKMILVGADMLEEAQGEIDRLTKLVDHLKSTDTDSRMKFAAMGEFHEYTKKMCIECSGEEGDEDCEICGGEGYYTDEVPVAWTTCKDIYECMHSSKVKGLCPNE